MEAAGLIVLIEIPQGDATQTLRQVQGPVDLRIMQISPGYCP